MVLAVGLRKFIARRVARTAFAKKAIEEKADLSAFKEKPSTKLMIGVFLIGFSFVICWPCVALCGILAVYFEEPLFIVIGGPAFYALSWLVWSTGMFLTGAENIKYGGIFLRWAVRRFVEKHAPEVIVIPDETGSPSDPASPSSTEP
jgi:hypothetical protein